MNKLINKLINELKTNPRLKDFFTKNDYYIKQAKDGHYNNPYDVKEELDNLIPNDINEDEKYYLEDLSHLTSLEFWSM